MNRSNIGREDWDGRNDAGTGGEEHLICRGDTEK